jgi:hypothetical protein
MVPVTLSIHETILKSGVWNATSISLPKYAVAVVCNIIIQEIPEKPAHTNSPLHESLWKIEGGKKVKSTQITMSAYEEQLLTAKSYTKLS